MQRLVCTQARGQSFSPEKRTGRLFRTHTHTHRDVGGLQQVLEIIRTMNSNHTHRARKYAHKNLTIIGLKRLSGPCHFPPKDARDVCFAHTHTQTHTEVGGLQQGLGGVWTMDSKVTKSPVLRNRRFGPPRPWFLIGLGPEKGPLRVTVSIGPTGGGP